MIVDKHISFVRLFKIIWKQMLAYTILSAAIIVPIAYFELGRSDYRNDHAVDFGYSLVNFPRLSNQ